MSTATSSAATFGERFAQWRKERRLERQGRNVASRQMRGGALIARYALLVVVALILVGPLVLPLMAAFKAPGESVFAARSLFSTSVAGLTAGSVANSDAGPSLPRPVRTGSFGSFFVSS